MPYELHIQIPDGELEDALRRLKKIGYTISGMETIDGKPPGKLAPVGKPFEYGEREAEFFKKMHKKSKKPKTKASRALVKSLVALPKGQREARVLEVARTFNGNPYTSRDVKDILKDEINETAVGNALWRLKTLGRLPPGFKLIPHQSRRNG